MDVDIKALVQALSDDQLSSSEIELLIDKYKQRPNFLNTLKEVNKRLVEALEEYYGEGIEAKDIINNLVTNINICLKYIKEFSKTEVQSDIPIIFAPRTMDETYFLYDLDSIPREQYTKIWETISSFVDGGCKFKGTIEETDVEKYKKTYGSNQIRLYGYYLPGNMAFVSGLYSKKSNWSKKDSNFVKSRGDSVRKDYQKAKDFIGLLVKQAKENLNQSVDSNVPFETLLPELLKNKEFQLMFEKSRDCFNKIMQKISPYLNEEYQNLTAKEILELFGSKPYEDYEFDKVIEGNEGEKPTDYDVEDMADEKDETSLMESDITPMGEKVEDDTLPQEKHPDKDDHPFIEKKEQPFTSVIMPINLENHRIPDEIINNLTKSKQNWIAKFNYLVEYYNKYHSLSALRQPYHVRDFENGDFVLNEKGKKIDLGRWYDYQKTKYKKGTLESWKLDLLKPLGFLEDLSKYDEASHLEKTNENESKNISQGDDNMENFANDHQNTEFTSSDDRVVEIGDIVKLNIKKDQRDRALFVRIVEDKEKHEPMEGISLIEPDSELAKAIYHQKVGHSGRFVIGEKSSIPATNEFKIKSIIPYEKSNEVAKNDRGIESHSIPESIDLPESDLSALRETSALRKENRKMPAALNDRYQSLAEENKRIEVECKAASSYRDDIKRLEQERVKLLSDISRQRREALEQYGLSISPVDTNAIRESELGIITVRPLLIDELQKLVEAMEVNNNNLRRIFETNNADIEKFESLKARKQVLQAKRAEIFKEIEDLLNGNNDNQLDNNDDELDNNDDQLGNPWQR